MLCVTLTKSHPVILSSSVDLHPCFLVSLILSFFEVGTLAHFGWKVLLPWQLLNDKHSSLSDFWWLVRVTLVVVFSFLPQNFARCHGLMNTILSLYTCRLSNEYTQRWWRHSNWPAIKLFALTSDGDDKTSRSYPSHLVKLSLIILVMWLSRSERQEMIKTVLMNKTDIVTTIVTPYLGPATTIYIFVRGR